MLTTAFILIRAIHFASCLLLLGAWAFDRLIAAPIMATTDATALRNRMLRRLTWGMLAAALLSGALWLAWVAAGMSGLPMSEALTFRTLSVVWGQTVFGAAWKWHLVCWIATALFTALATLRSGTKFLQSGLAWCAIVAGGALVASLAWAGHGLMGSTWHRAADVCHLVAAGIWPGGLVPYLCLLRAVRVLTPGERRNVRWMLTRRFSMMSLIAVLALCATGLINSWCLVGSVSAMTSTPYGRWLIAKILVFLAMVGFGAMNFLRWKPRLSGADAEHLEQAESAGRWIHINVTTEILLAGIIILIVGILGILPPPV